MARRSKQYADKYLQDGKLADMLDEQEENEFKHRPRHNFIGAKSTDNWEMWDPVEPKEKPSRASPIRWWLLGGLLLILIGGVTFLILG